MNLGGYMYLVIDVLAVMALGGALIYGINSLQARRRVSGDMATARSKSPPRMRAAGFIGLFSAAAFIVAVVVAGVMQATPEDEFPSTADYGEARTPSVPNTTPDVANPVPPLNPHQPSDTE